MTTTLDKIRAFKKAYMDLVEEWDSNSVMEDLDHEFYPFDKSFDELEVCDWCDDLEEQLTLMPHGKAMHDFAINEIDHIVANAEGNMDTCPVVWDYAWRTIELYRKQFSITDDEADEWFARLKEIDDKYYKRCAEMQEEK